MKAHPFSGRPCDWGIPRSFLITVIALALINLTSCGRYSNGKAIDDAVSKNDLEKIKAMLNDDAGLVSCKDSWGWTPLHFAARDNSKDAAQLLLASKANVNARDYSGETPLQLAVLDNSKEVAELLLASNADVNTTDCIGRTPLHWAVILDRTDIAELLLGGKADVNAKDIADYTPLRYVLMLSHKDTDMEQLLRKFGDHE